MSIKTIYCSLFLLLLWSAKISAQHTLVHSGDIWEYLDDGTNPGYDWTEGNFPTEEWKKGPSPLGYGYKELATTINYGDTTVAKDEADKYITSYFKTSIFIEDIGKHLSYQLNYKRDDGAIIYINNKEVVRSNMPEGRINHLTASNGMVTGSGENKVLTIYLDPLLFHQGNNYIAVEIHQRSRRSSDLIMDFELIAIDDQAELHQLLKHDRDHLENDKLALMDLKYELNQELIRNDFDNKIMQVQWLLIALGILFFYRRYQQQQKEKERQEVSKKELEEQLSSKAKESINLTITGIRNKYIFKEIKMELLQIASTHSGAKKELSKIINRIDVQSQNEEDWERMKLHLDTIYSGFFERLSEQYPNLSQQELRHCGFMKLRLDTKEISQILRIDPKSVQSARYRIKKKMNLSDQEDLRTVVSEY